MQLLHHKVPIKLCASITTELLHCNKTRFKKKRWVKIMKNTVCIPVYEITAY